MMASQTTTPMKMKHYLIIAAVIVAGNVLYSCIPQHSAYYSREVALAQARIDAEPLRNFSAAEKRALFK
jgi:hypothetical protein